jgi:hypothetical protein
LIQASWKTKKRMHKQSFMAEEANSEGSSNNRNITKPEKKKEEDSSWEEVNHKEEELTDFVNNKNNETPKF